ncbi:hypothetical protein [Rhodococcus globerulus]|uniref:hypothetical protein n=1 Tax=Rhodococcus globerulus TaxID=33008 RepID=UPI001C560657|nr:hypothetical protein [Rhodococcus globerulus]QXW04035.1 hypothetical protein KYT97_08450 [Rhodococcus globerulus]
MDNFRNFKSVKHLFDVRDRQITLVREDLTLNHAGIALCPSVLVRVIPESDVQHPLIAGELSGQLPVDPKFGLD